jgi:hypothetical protein
MRPGSGAADWSSGFAAATAPNSTRQCWTICRILAATGEAHGDTSEEDQSTEDRQEDFPTEEDREAGCWKAGSQGDRKEGDARQGLTWRPARFRVSGTCVRHSGSEEHCRSGHGRGAADTGRLSASPLTIDLYESAFGRPRGCKCRLRGAWARSLAGRIEVLGDVEQQLVHLVQDRSLVLVLALSASQPLSLSASQHVWRAYDRSPF